ncbi:hypothetical protein V8F20_010864 [Naviculisporaceae sp. PSN 640]
MTRPNSSLVICPQPEDEVSQAIEPEWLQVQKSASPSTSDFKDGTIVKIDCTEEVSKKWCQKERIKSFPTIRLYRNDVPGSLRYERYRGPPKAAAILGFLRRSLQPVVSMVDEKNITEFSKRDDVVFVGRIPGQENGKPSQAEGLFQAAAVKYRDRFSFALEVDGAKGREPSVSCWNNLDGLKHETTQLQTRELLEKFIELCSTPLIPEMTRRNELGFYETRKSIVHYFTSNEQEQQEYVKEMRPLAKKYHEYLHFTTTDVNEYPEAPEMMGFKWGYSTGLSVQNPNNGDIYPYTRSQPLSARAVELFLSDIIQGKVKPLAADTGGDTGARGGQQGRREHEEL